MTKQQKQFIVIGIMAAILVIILLGNLKKKPKVPSSDREVSSSAAPVIKRNEPSLGLQGPAVSAADEKKLKIQAERLNLSWGRDPFWGSLEKDYQTSELELKGISYAKGKEGFAFINNEIVQKGDKVGDYEVLEIEKDRVLLRKAGQNFYLAFPVQEQ